MSQRLFTGGEGGGVRTFREKLLDPRARGVFVGGGGGVPLFLMIPIETCNSSSGVDCPDLLLPPHLYSPHAD